VQEFHEHYVDVRNTHEIEHADIDNPVGLEYDLLEPVTQLGVIDLPPPTVVIPSGVSFDGSRYRIGT